MIELLLSTAWSAPDISLTSESYLYTSGVWEQRLLGRFQSKLDNWTIDFRSIEQITATQHQMNIQGWELYYSYPLAKNSYLRIGQQTIRFGQLDILSDLDMINGQDLSLGPTIMPEWKRIPSLAIQFHSSWGFWSTSLQWLPISARDRISWFGSPWGILSPNDIHNVIEEAQSWSGDFVTESWIRDMLSSAQKNINNQQELSIPNPQSLDYGDIAFQLNRETLSSSSSLYLAWMNSRRPQLRLHPNLRTYLEEERLPTSLELSQINEIIEEPISLSYPRLLLLGADLATTLSVFGLRAEASYNSNRVRMIQNLQSATRPYISAAIALDYAFGMSLVALEARAHHVIEPVSKPWLEANDTIQIALLGQISLPDAWNLQISGQYDTILKDFFAQIHIQKRFSPQWALSLQGMMLNGPQSNSPLQYPSGILGQWREYDHLSFRIHWNP